MSENSNSGDGLDICREKLADSQARNIRLAAKNERLAAENERLRRFVDVYRGLTWADVDVDEDRQAMRFALAELDKGCEGGVPQKSYAELQADLELWFRLTERCEQFVTEDCQIAPVWHKDKWQWQRIDDDGLYVGNIFESPIDCLKELR